VWLSVLARRNQYSNPQIPELDLTTSLGKGVELRY
jgi:hypothetical protein